MNCGRNHTNTPTTSASGQQGSGHPAPERLAGPARPSAARGSHGGHGSSSSRPPLSSWTEFAQVVPGDGADDLGGQRQGFATVVPGQPEIEDDASPVEDVVALALETRRGHRDPLESLHVRPGRCGSRWTPWCRRTVRGGSRSPGGCRRGRMSSRKSAVPLRASRCSKPHPRGMDVRMQGTQDAVRTDWAIRTTPLEISPSSPPEQVGILVDTVVVLEHPATQVATRRASSGRAAGAVTAVAPGCC